MLKSIFTGLLLVTLFGASAQVTQNSLHFDGTNDHVQTTYDGISLSNARTVEAWIKTTANSLPSGGQQRVIADYGSTFPNGSRFTLNLLWNNAPRVEIGGGGLSSTTAVNDGNWHHIAAVYDPTATKKYIIYIDGVFDTSGNISQPINTGTTTDFVIGRRIDNVNYFEGQIDEVRFWNTARTATEIADNYDEEICPNATGLDAYYDFNSGTANSANTGITVLDDLTSGSKNGTLTNFGLSGSTSNWTNGTNITSAPNSDTVLYDTACGFYQSPSGQFVFSSQQIVEHTPNALGCDSAITINVHIHPSPDVYVNEF
ncbi:MAG: LamG domain-containing protein, partial [Bacteroidia bacterium]